MDRSTRSYDQDGHLRVLNNVLTAAGTSPYVGSEIPDANKLGLSPDRVYTLLRPANELERAASSLAGKPVLMRHVPISSADHPHDDVVGAVGSDVAFDGEIMTGSLTFWTDDAIAAIENNTLRDLSCGYWFKPVMTPGRFDGVAYDGVMTALAFNHLSLVIDGRVPGAMVGDSALRIKNHVSTGQYTMSTTEVIRQIQAIDQARINVRPYAGEITMAVDSADGVYLAALSALGHDVRDLAKHPGTATAVWPALKSHKARSVGRAPAMDSKTVNKRNEMFPQGNRLSRTGY